MPENLKNVLLVMSSGGYLVHPTQDSSNEKVWVETWKRIDRFLPGLRQDLALDDAALADAKSDRNQAAGGADDAKRDKS